MVSWREKDEVWSFCLIRTTLQRAKSWENEGKAFIYRTAPVIRILGFEDFMGGGAYPVPILEQYANYRITIEVLDVYGTDTCYVDSGKVTIYDDVGGDPSNPITLELQDGQVMYEFTPMEPNILGGGSYPYQKLIQFVAHFSYFTAFH